MSQRCQPPIAVLVIALAAACGALERDAIDPAAPAAVAVIRLLDRLDGARIDAPGGDPFLGELGAAAAADRLLLDEFAPEDPFPGRWRSRAFVTAALQSGADAANQIAPRPAHPRRDGERTTIEIAPDEFLLTTAPATEDASYLLRAWLRPLAVVPEAPPDPSTDAPPPPPTASLAFAPLDHPPALDGDLAADLVRHAAEFRRRPRTTALPPTASTTEWHELRALARPYAGRRALAFAINGGASGVELDRVELRRLTPAETLALTPDETVELPTDPHRRRVELDLETWDCLALPAPSSVEFDLALPAQGARLQLGVAALATADGEPPRLAGLLIDGKCALPLLAVEPPTGRRDGIRRWQSCSIDLAPFAGRQVTLRFVATGTPGDVLLLGAPTVLPTPAAHAGVRPPNVIVLSLDTLRADHVGCYGGTAVATPAIDALAARGTRFARVFSPASYTLPTHLALLSGQDPLVHDTVASTDPMDPLRTLPLAARLRDAGYRTAAFTAGGLVHPRYGFGVGYDQYSIRDPGGVVGLHRRIGDAQDDDAQPGEDRMGEVIDWITAGGGAPFHLFLHTYLVHNYRPHQPWLDRTGGGARPTPAELTRLRAAAAGGDTAANERMRALYVASLAQADAEIVGRLLSALDALGLAQRTIVALVADHGEEFLEHGMVGHGDELWHTLTQVPWIVAGPGVPVGAVREEPVVLADVAPTLAGLLDLEHDPRVLAVDRFSAAALARAAEGEPEPLTLSLRRIAKRPDQDALVLWPWKLVRRRVGERPWPAALFRLDEDPGETRDRAADEPQRAAGMQRLLDARLRELGDQKAALPSQAGPRRFEPSPELDRMLDQLGYTEREEDEGAASSSDGARDEPRSGAEDDADQ